MRAAGFSGGGDEGATGLQSMSVGCCLLPSGDGDFEKRDSTRKLIPLAGLSSALCIGVSGEVAPGEMAVTGERLWWGRVKAELLLTVSVLLDMLEAGSYGVSVIAASL